jgi:hypothetical protein
MVASFGFPEGQPFEFSEALGLVDGEECADLVSELGDQLADFVGSDEELADVFTVATGPRVGGSPSLLMTFDMMTMLDQMGQASDEELEAMMKALYGERMSFAMVTSGDVLLATGGSEAVDHLGELASMLTAPTKAPSFAPLDARPGLMIGVNLGGMFAWLKSAIPEDAAELEEVAERLRGEVGRIPMALAFDSKIATFDTAMSLEALEVITAIIEEEQAKTVQEERSTADDDL